MSKKNVKKSEMLANIKNAEVLSKDKLDKVKGGSVGDEHWAG